MQLKVRDGELTLESVFTLFFWAALIWIGGIAALAMIIAVLAFLFVTLWPSPITIHGETFTLQGSSLPAMMLFLLIVVFGAAMTSAAYAGFLTGCLRIYRLWRPLTVIVEDSPGDG